MESTVLAGNAVKQLTFSSQMSVADFKAKNNNNPIEIVKNPKTGKLFFNCGTISGAVSANYRENPVMSEVATPDGEVFFLLHKKSSTNTIDVL